MELKNYTETVVKEIYTELAGQRSDLCKCEKCRLDVLAMALNNLQPLYYVSERGQVFSRLQSTYTEIKTRVLTEVLKAIRHVEKQPKHL